MAEVRQPAVATASTTALTPPKKSFGKLLWKSMRDFPMIYLGGAIVLFLAVVAIFAPYLAPYNPVTQFNNGLTAQGLPVAPSKLYPWGTDSLGRDILSRVIYGSRVSLEVGVFATIINLVIGVPVGLISGYFGGVVDMIISRIVDTVLAFPLLLFALALVAVLGPSITNIYITIGVLGWGVIARVVRSAVLSIKEFEYVQAERALGASTLRIIFRVILPNTLGPVIVLTALSVGGNILLEAALSYLGIGVQPPTPSWGNMINEGLNTYQFAPWTLWFPGLALVVAVLGFNLLGDGLRDVLDPHNMTH